MQQQFQILVIFGFVMSIFVNWVVFGGTTFSVGFTRLIAVLFLAIAFGIVYWTFFTPSGKAFANKYNKSSNQKISTTSQQRKIAKSQAYKFGIAGSFIGLIISLPSIWAAFQMLNIAGGGNFAWGYLFGVMVAMFIGYLNGFGQGMKQFEVRCAKCKHNFVLQDPGGECPACETRLYIDEHGECKEKLTQKCN